MKRTKNLIAFASVFLALFLIFSRRTVAQAVECSAMFTTDQRLCEAIIASLADPSHIVWENGGCYYKFEASCVPTTYCCRPESFDSNYCPQVWDYAYNPVCVGATYDPESGNAGYTCRWNYQHCGAGDRCGPCTNGSGSQVVCAGQCADTGCVTGGWYKTCCQLSGAAVVGTRLSGVNGTCSDGGCSSGVPVRWADFSSPGPACSNALCLQSWDGWSWVVDTCGAGAPPTSAPGGPTPAPVVSQPPPATGSFCGSCSGYWSCDWGGSGGCGTSPCERLYFGYGPEPCPDTGPIHGGSRCCSWCYSIGWDKGCGSASPASPTLYFPANGAVINGAGIEFKWYKFQGGESGSCGGCDTDGANHCWGFRCASGSYGMPLSVRKFELFVSRVPDLSAGVAANKNPDHWGAPRVTIASSHPDLLIRGESGYTTPDLISRAIDFSASPAGIYWWFVRACNPDGCRDSSLRSFSYCASLPPGQATCQTPADGEILNDSTVNLVWTGPASWGQGCPDNTGYEVYIGTSYPPSSWSGIRDNASPLQYTNLDYGKEYFWTVKTVNNTMFTYGPVCNFFVREPDPWWQSRDGDIHANVNFSSTLIPNCSPTAKFLSMDGAGGSPGLVSWGGATPPNVDKGEISSTKWQANTAVPTTFNFDYLKNRLKVDESVVLPVAGGVASIPKPEPGKVGVYYLDNSSTVRLTGRSLAAGEKVIIYAAGEVTVSTNDITLGEGAFFALISRGNINFSAEIGEAQGFFFSDQEINVNFGKKAFTGKGSFIGLAAVSLNRNLSNGTTGNCTASHTFVSMPELFFNAPDEFKYSTFLFRELAP